MPELVKKPIDWLPQIDWSVMADGKQRRFVCGKDFTKGKQESVQSSSSAAARVRGMRSRTRRDGDDMIIQWFPKN